MMSARAENMRRHRAVALAIGVLMFAAPARAADPPAGIAFDQIDRTLLPSEPVPAAGSFNGEYALALEASKAAGTDVVSMMGGGANGLALSAISSLPGVGGAIGARVAALQMQVAAMRVKAVARAEASGGRLTRYAFYDGAMRTEVPGLFTVIISPERREAIFINERAKTFHRASIPPDTASAPLTAPTATMHVSATSEAAPSVTIDGVARTGRTIEHVYRLTGGTGVCADQVYRIRETVYDGDAPSPPVAQVQSALLAAYATPLGCQATIVQDEPAPPAPDHIAAFQTLQLIPDPARSGTSLAATLLSERGNVRTLGPADAGLFDVPPGYRET